MSEEEINIPTVNPLTEKDLNVVLSWTPKAMPNAPTAMGWSADKIKIYQWKGYEKLFNLISNGREYISQIATALKAQHNYAEATFFKKADYVSYIQLLEDLGNRINGVAEEIAKCATKEEVDSVASGEGIKDLAITPEKTDFVKAIRNLVNPEGLYKGKRWWDSNGKVLLSGEEADGFNGCIRIDIHDYEHLTLNGFHSYFTYLTDSEGNMISKLSSNHIDNSEGQYYFLYVTFYNQTEFIVVNADVSGALSLNDYPYDKPAKVIIDNLDSGFDDVITKVKNIYDSATMITMDTYWWGGNNVVSASSSEGFKAVRLSVKPNTWYTVSKKYHTYFSYCTDQNDKLIGKVIEVCETSNNSIKTPSNGAYLYLTYVSSDDMSNFVVLNAKTDSISSYLDVKYDEVVGAELKEINDGITMHYLYVSTTGNDDTGDGTKNNPYASIFKANESISDNGYLNRYTIIVKKGTYTDLQERYSGNTTTGKYKGIVCKNYVYYESEDIDHPESCVIQWDGATGFESGTLNDTISADMCPFHISTADETSVKGFKLSCKNMRYCFHVEQNSKSKWIVENCIFDWNGVPDVVQVYKNRACVGMGIGYLTDGTFKECIFNNVENGYMGLQSHDNPPASTDYFLMTGAKITCIDCQFNNTTIQMRSTHEGRTMPYVITIKGCGGISRLYDMGSVEPSYWRADVSGSMIDQLDISEH